MKNKNKKPQTSKRKKSSPKTSSATVRVVGILQNGQKLIATLKNDAPPVADSRDRTIVVASDTSATLGDILGSASAGAYGCAIGGMRCSAETGRAGLAYVLSGKAYCAGPAGIAINRSGSSTLLHPPANFYSAEAADLLAATFDGGSAKMDGEGIAIAINQIGSLDATAQASPGGLIIFGYFPNPTTILYVPVQVDGIIIKGNTPYKLNGNYQPVPA
jgi:hypothetical protein